MKTLLIVGKGGVGKTTLTHALGTYLSSTGQRVLLIDADADGTLGWMVQAPESLSVADLKEDLKETRNRDIPDLHPCLAPVSDTIDLIRIGQNEGPGCYCNPNNRLRVGLQSLIESAHYDWILVDSHAGSEFISRCVVTPTDVLLVQRGEPGHLSQRVGHQLVATLEALGYTAHNHYVIIGGEQTNWKEGVWIPHRQDTLTHEDVQAILSAIQLKESASVA